MSDVIPRHYLVEQVERDEDGQYLCPHCDWPFPSASAAVACDCD